MRPLSSISLSSLLRQGLFWIFAALATGWGIWGMGQHRPASPLADIPLPSGEEIGIFAPTRPYSLPEILEPANPAAAFAPYPTAPGAITGNERIHVWLRIPLHNPTDEPRTHVIEVTQGWINLARLYDPHPDGTGHIIYQHHPGSDPTVRPIPFTQPAFSVQVEPGATKVCYLALQDEHWVNPAIVFWPSLDDFLIQQRQDDRFIHIYLGLMVGLFVANLCVLVAFRHRDLTYYLLYLLASCVLNALNFDIYSSYTQDIAWLAWATPGTKSGFTLFHGMLLLTAALLLLFSAEFLNLRQRGGWWARLVHVYICGLTVLTPLVILGPGSVLGDGLRLPVTLLWATATALVILLGLDAARQRVKYAQYLLPAMALLGWVAWRYTAAVLRGESVDNGILHQWLYASCVEMVILAYGLVDRFLAEKRARERAQHEALEAASREARLQREFNTELTRTVDERTTELRAANAQKERFITFLAHDIRTPLNSLVSVSSLLTRDPARLPADDLSAHALEIEANARGVSELMENLLSWARIQNDQVQLRTQEYLVADLFEAADRNLHTLARRKQLTLTWDSPRHTYVHCDFVCITSVLRNLVGNAIKFVPEQGRITVQAIVEETHVCFEVADEGVGMDADALARIRAAEPLPSQTGLQGESGAGLGLSICFHFLARHDSALTVESTPGTGTVFRFRLPLATA